MQSSFVQGGRRVAARPGRSLDLRSFASPPRDGFAPAPGLPMSVTHRLLARILYPRVCSWTGVAARALRSSLPICEHVFAYGRLHPVLPIRARGGPRGPARAHGRGGGASARRGGAGGGRGGGAPRRGGRGRAGGRPGGGGRAPAPAPGGAPPP